VQFVADRLDVLRRVVGTRDEVVHRVGILLAEAVAPPAVRNGRAAIMVRGRVSDHPTDFIGSIPDAITSSIKERIPDAKVEVSGGGGHYTIVVVSSVFAGKSLLESQRLVLSSIKHMINGAAPPVHAVDSLITKTP
jgi:acid stress-induced BolA-like protein IbaG/YrbA